VADNGVGFDLAAPRQPQSMGLMGLRERVQLMGAELEVISRPGEGTRIEVRAPLAGDDTAAPPGFIGAGA